MTGEVLQPQIISELVSEDGETHIKLLDSFEEDGIEKTTLELKFPRELRTEYPFLSTELHADVPHGFNTRRPSTPKDDFFDTFGGNGFWNWAAHSEMNTELLTALGYGVKIDELTLDDSMVVTIEHSAPSVERWGTVLGIMSGEASPPLSYVQYQGGTFSRFDATLRFIGDREVQFATEQPLKSHDLSNHAVGYALMGDVLIDTVAQRMQPAVEREKIERSLPSLVSATSNRPFSHVNELDQPARSIIEKQWDRLDILSARLADVFFYRGGNAEGDTMERLQRQLGYTFGAIEQNDPLDAFFDPLDRELERKIADEIMQRFFMLEQTAQLLDAA